MQGGMKLKNEKRKLKDKDVVTVKNGKTYVRIRLKSGNFTKEELQSIVKLIEDAINIDT